MILHLYVEIPAHTVAPGQVICVAVAGQAVRQKLMEVREIRRTTEGYQLMTAPIGAPARYRRTSYTFRAEELVLVEPARMGADALLAALPPVLHEALGRSAVLTAVGVGGDLAPQATTGDAERVMHGVVETIVERAARNDSGFGTPEQVEQWNAANDAAANGEAPADA